MNYNELHYLCRFAKPLQMVMPYSESTLENFCAKFLPLSEQFLDPIIEIILLFKRL